MCVNVFLVFLRCLQLPFNTLVIHGTRVFATGAKGNDLRLFRFVFYVMYVLIYFHWHIVRTSILVVCCKRKPVVNMNQEIKVH